MTPNRYDLSLGSDKSGSLTRDNGSYDISEYSLSICNIALLYCLD